jgi:D-serine deaminase-like pyridoxal phosphate-dependent protein
MENPMPTFDPVPSVMTLEELPTPSLILSIDKFDRNVEQMRSALSRHSVQFRPHLKTAKSVDLAMRLFKGTSMPVTVSTLKEAEVFADAGLRDIFYAVGVAPSKLPRVIKLLDRGVDIAVLIDSLEQAEAVTAHSREQGKPIPTFLEVDCGDHRSGILPTNQQLLTKIAKIVSEGAELRGVATHCGRSYWAGSLTAIQELAITERDAAVQVAKLLRGAGHAVPVVSVGSTPTALHAKDLSGVTEVRAGVFMFFDMVQVGAESCSIDDVALSILATVIGKNSATGHYIIDAGWMAVSRDRGTASQNIDQKYGLVCDVSGRPFKDLLVLDANQEHGIVGLREGSMEDEPELAIGSKIRILPNHACAAAAQHDCYHVVTGDATSIDAVWPRFSGW